MIPIVLTPLTLSPVSFGAIVTETIPELTVKLVSSILTIPFAEVVASECTLLVITPVTRPYPSTLISVTKEVSPVVISDLEVATVAKSISLALITIRSSDAVATASSFGLGLIKPAPARVVVGAVNCVHSKIELPIETLPVVI